MKHKLALLNEVLARQAAAFAELQAANRCVGGGDWVVHMRSRGMCRAAVAGRSSQGADGCRAQGAGQG
jgi:hypothetical protein